MSTPVSRITSCHRSWQSISRRLRASFCEPPRFLDPHLMVSRRTLTSADGRHQGNSRSAIPKFRKPPSESTNILINREGLLPTRMHHGEDNRPPLKGLAKELELMIMLNGPITVAEYMIHALQHPKYGYYMRQDEKIGRGGDFITAPEISQAFGEMIGIWCVASWKEMDSPPKMHLVELGPGKGTLMVDILRTATSFPEFREALTLHMVETSGDLKELQMKALGATPAPDNSSSVYRGDTNGGSGSMQLPGGGQIFWHSKLEEVPKGDPTLVIGQEFLDALPVHQFQYTAEGWRERLVDINIPGAGGEEVVDRAGENPVVKSGTVATERIADEGDGGDGDNKKDQEVPDFRFVLSAEETPAVLTYLTKRDPTDVKLIMGGLKSSRGGRGREGGRREARGTKPGPHGEQVGDRLEVSGESILLVKEVAERIAKDGGGALFIDYGEAHALEDSLRCFKGHEEVPVLADPGEVDMTVDVNFGLLRRIVAGVEGAQPHGPVGQGQFLREMGIGARLTALAEQPSVTDEQADAMLEGYVRLVDPDKMGKRYKVLGITEERQPMPPPGFMSEVDPDLRKD